jgi:hypothetical protein
MCTAIILNDVPAGAEWIGVLVQVVNEPMSLELSGLTAPTYRGKGDGKPFGRF